MNSTTSQLSAVALVVVEAGNYRVERLINHRSRESRLRRDLDDCVANKNHIFAELIELIQFLSTAAPDQDWLSYFGVVCVDGQYALSATLPERF